jgi:hypothetical protein
MEFSIFREWALRLSRRACHVPILKRLRMGRKRCNNPYCKPPPVFKIEALI